MNSILTKGIVRGGQIEVAQPINLPDGSEVIITNDGSLLNAATTPQGWTESKNERRCNLIRKKFAQGIDAAEQNELAMLQDELTAHRKRSVPLPYDVIEELQVALNAPAANAS